MYQYIGAYILSLYVLFFHCSFHPYIFFNKDHNSMTFVGFNVKDNGDLIDPATKNVIHKQLFTRQLLVGLKAQKVFLTDNDSNNQLVMYSVCIIPIFICREELLHKLFMVMGINTELLNKYPDSSYVLTADNTKKILAILMRFRY